MRRIPTLSLVCVALIGALPATAAAETTLAAGAGFESRVVSTNTGDVVVWSRGRGSLMSADRAVSGSWGRAVQVVAASTLTSVESGAVRSVDLAGNARGDAAAAWLTKSDTGFGLAVSRRPVGGPWGSVEVLLDRGLSGDASLPITVFDVEVAPDGTVVVAAALPSGSARIWERPAGAAEWSIHDVGIGAPSGGVPDIALAVVARDKAGVLWSDAAGIAFARRDARGWAMGARPDGDAARAFYPSLAVGAGGRLVAAWQRGGRVWSADRADGRWTAPLALGRGFAPDITVRGDVAAIGWQTSGVVVSGVAVRRAGGDWLKRTLPFTGPQTPAMIVARDRSVIAVGTKGPTVTSLLGWSRLAPGATTWSPIRFESRPLDLTTIWSATLAASPPGVRRLATLAWTGSVAEGRLGLPRGGGALQTSDVDPGDGGPGLPVLRIERPVASVPVRAVLRLEAGFVRYTGPVTATVERRQGGRWRPIARARLDVGRPAFLRFGRPGPVDVRFAYGPRARRVTGSVRVQVTRTERPRIVAGHLPVSIAAVGRSLWVVSVNQRGLHELRLLDADTGKLRSGPLLIPGAAPSGASVRRFSDKVVLSGDLKGAGTSAAVVLRPALIAKGANALAARIGRFGTKCELEPCPQTVVSGLSGESIETLEGRGGVALGYGSMWTPALAEGLYDDGPPAAIVRRDPLTRAVLAMSRLLGPVTLHGGERDSDLVAVKGGAWFLDAHGVVHWVGIDGSLGSAGPFVAIESDGTRTLALRSNEGTRAPIIVQLRPGGGAIAGDAQLVERTSVASTLALGRRRAWVISLSEATLIPIDLPPG